ncbi:MAG: HNH endonuclease [Lewinellaceae bacterium]|nr:HNH endonuclease [Lewinellaceae bacterium]
MSEYVPEKLRSLVIARASHCCEYCLMHDSDLIFSGHIDHIISLKHEGPTEAGNLAYSCLVCNVNKGTDVASYLREEDEYYPLFHPRRDNWHEHFYLQEGRIIAKTKIGEVTVRILQFNRTDRVQRRLLLEKVGRYPGK